MLIPRPRDTHDHHDHHWCEEATAASIKSRAPRRPQDITYVWATLTAIEDARIRAHACCNRTVERKRIIVTGVCARCGVLHTEKTPGCPTCYMRHYLRDHPEKQHTNRKTSKKGAQAI